MKLKVFTLHYDPEGGFDDAPVQRFLQDKVVLEISEQFFIHEQRPVWALLVRYRDRDDSGGPERKRVRDQSFLADLSPEELKRYERIRTWRNTRAEREGRPPFALMTNKQLATVAQRRPNSLEALRKIPGFGEQKVKAFGQELLAQLQAEVTVEA